jgi:F-type H+-transporting ATPase subunit delta
VTPEERAVAARYARALFEAARSAGAAEALGEELRRLRAAVRAVPEFAAALRHPRLSSAVKARLYAAALGADPSALLERTLVLLTTKKRLGLLAPLSALYEDFANAASGVVGARVTGAAPLPDAQRDRLVRTLSRVLGARVSLDEGVDESLIGGFVLHVGDRRWDASLRGDLERLRERLMTAAAH